MYCSGIAFKEGSGATVITAEDIRQNARGRQLAYWVTLGRLRQLLQNRDFSAPG